MQAYERETFTLRSRTRTLRLNATDPVVVGILNRTPDSFSDGGQFLELEHALSQARAMLQQGVRWIDVGGESSRPGAEPVSLEEERRRVLPLLRGLRELSDDVFLSIDTTKAALAREALESGADVVNDISAGRLDPAMFETVAAADVPLILNHMRGEPRTMQRAPSYEDVCAEVYAELAKAREEAIRAGVRHDQIVLDPGIGFGKRLEDNLALLRDIHTFRSLGAPLFIGTSRKRFLGEILERPEPMEREAGNAAVTAHLVGAGVSAIRVHDTRQALDVVRVSRLLRSEQEGRPWFAGSAFEDAPRKR